MQPIIFLNFYFSVAKPVSTEPYLSTLNQAELEALGLKAVSAGANPQKLQQAFATAQIKGDWTKLEKEIAAVLGLQAINHPEIGLAIQCTYTLFHIVIMAEFTCLFNRSIMT